MGVLCAPYPFACVLASALQMIYNLGAAGIQTFTTFNDYVRKHDWSGAANDLKGTLWCRQVRE